MSTSPSDAQVDKLIDTVKAGIARRGYYFLGEHLMKKLLEGKETQATRMKRLRDFAGACGTRCDANERMTTALFRSAGPEDMRLVCVVTAGERLGDKFGSHYSAA